MVTISAPSSLATFAASASKASSSRPAAHVSLSPVEGSHGRQGVATVQGDGIWTYDLKNLRPISTFTVPPSTRFTSSALSYIVPAPNHSQASQTSNRKGKGKEKERVQEDVDMGSDAEAEGAEQDSSDQDESPPAPSGPRRRTLVGVQANKGKVKGEVWIWEGEEGAEKTVLNIAKPATHLHLISPTSSYPVVNIHDSTSISLITALDVIVPLSCNTTTPSHLAIASILVPGDSGSDAGPTSSGLINVEANGRVVSLRIEHPDDGEPSVSIITDQNIGTDVAQASIKDDGIIVGVTQSGDLFTYDTRSSTLISRTPLSAPTKTPTLAFLPESKPLILLPARSEHATATNLSLVAALASSSPAVLTVSDISSLVPSTQCTITSVKNLGSTSPGVVVIGVVAWHAQGEGASLLGEGRSVLHVLEVTIPEKATGMKAILGSANTTKRYFTLPPAGAVTATAKSGGSSARSFNQQGPNAFSRITLLLDKVHRSSTDWDEALSSFSHSSASAIPSKLLIQVLKAGMTEARGEEVYRAILALPPPDMTFRMELRRQLSVEDACEVLGMLVRWAEERAEENSGVSFGDVEGDGRDEANAKANGEDEMEVEGGGAGQNDASKFTQSAPSPPTTPSLNSILSHSSTLLDAHLPLLIDHPTSHPLLERLSASLTPLLAHQGTLRQLRAPIDALLTLANREERRVAALSEKRAVNAQHAHSKLAIKGREEGGVKIGLGANGGLWNVEDFQF